MTLRGFQTPAGKQVFSRKKGVTGQRGGVWCIRASASGRQWKLQRRMSQGQLQTLGELLTHLRRHLLPPPGICPCFESLVETQVEDETEGLRTGSEFHFPEPSAPSLRLLGTSGVSRAASLRLLRVSCWVLGALSITEFPCREFSQSQRQVDAMRAFSVPVTQEKCKRALVSHCSL